jgi:hypothetical protein
MSIHESSAFRPDTAFHTCPVTFTFLRGFTGSIGFAFECRFKSPELIITTCLANQAILIELAACFCQFTTQRVYFRINRGSATWCGRSGA